MGGWRGYLKLQAEARTGLSLGLLVWASLSGLFAGLTFTFVLLGAFIWLAERYRPLTAALVLGAFFLVVTILALIRCLRLRRRTIERAELALAARRNTALVDRNLLGAVVRLGQSVGWRRAAPLLAAAVLVAGAGLQWLGRSQPESESTESSHRGLARAA